MRLERWLSAGGSAPDDADGQALLSAILASGSFLTDLLLSDPAQLGELFADPWLRQPKPGDRIAAAVRDATRGARDFADLQRRLRGVRRREMLRLGAREIGWGTTEEVARELSALADACIAAALGFCHEELARSYGEPVGLDERAAFVVLGMGKLGGEELNFCSDVDLLYLYASDDGHAGRLSLHEFYAKLGERVTRAIDEATADGIVFRVDLRLRPEGRSGAICNSLGAAERYYETFGRTWERQVWLRARSSAGDRVLGEEARRRLEPFVYPRSLDPKRIDDVLSLRRLFVTESEAQAGFDVKLASGGIRDVELVAQTLQLLHGGKKPDLRDANTLRALDRLHVAGLLRGRERRALGEAYRFWRRVEHRLQLEGGAQTHRVPAGEVERRRLARRLGFAAIEPFDVLVAKHRKAVLKVASTLGEPPSGPRPEVLRILDPVRSVSEIETDLEALGFRDLETSAHAIEVARGRLLPAFVEEAAASPDPDRALEHFRDLALRGSDGLVALLASHPPLLRALANLFGTSAYLSRLLVLHPERWGLFLGGLGAPRRRREDLDQALAERLAGLDDEEILREMRRFHVEEVLRVGLHDVAGTLAAAEVGEQLVSLAEVSVQHALQLATRQVEAKYGRPGASLTLLAFGSLGARNMRYGSDLDLVFLYSREGATDRGVDHQEWYARLAQRLIGALGARLAEGRLYEIDTRLRPSGQQGMLVTSIEAFRRYHRAAAAAWERLALLRARPIGEAPPELTEEIARIVYEGPVDGAVLSAELARVRAKMERERAAVGPGERHLRLGAGGLADVEFIAGLGQLLFGRDDPLLRTTAIAPALDRLAARGWPDTTVARDLLDDYRFLGRIVLRLRLLSDRPDDVLAPQALDPLARSLGLGTRDLDEQIDRRCARVRRALATAGLA